MNNIKTGTILVLAAAAMLTAGCDPFPKAPGGAPKVLRAVSTGGSVGGNIEQSVDLPADPTAIVVDDATGDANFYVWFTKEMDGSTIQAAPDIDPATGLPPAGDPCDLAGSPLSVSANFPAGTTLCYASGSAQGGGILSLVPGDYLDVGAYTIGGTVKDYQGIPLTFNATFNVTHKPWLVPSDAYTIDVGWTNDSTATGFTIERTADANAAGDAPAADATWTTVAQNRQWAPPTSTGNNAIFRNAGLEPGTTYFYRITPEGVAGAVASTFKAGDSLARPNIKTSVNPTLADGTVTTNTVQIAMARIRSAAYRVQFTTVIDSPAETDWVDADPANMLTTLGAALTNPITPRATNPFLFNVSGLAPGTYLARIVPEWTGVVGTPDGAGTPTNSSQFTIPTPPPAP
jgi:hypothetical protein